MELQFFGGNCIKISTKKASAVVDDNLADVGLKSVLKPDDIAIFTSEKLIKNEPTSTKLVIKMPGEYEVSGISVRGVSARAHMDEEGQKTAIIYKIISGDINLAVVGHVHPDITEDQLESIGHVDVLCVPIGGNGYTVDPIGALKVIKKFEPKIIIPTHYDDKDINFEVPQAQLDDFIKETSLDVKERLPKLKLKRSDLPEMAELIVLERQ